MSEQAKIVEQLDPANEALATLLGKFNQGVDASISFLSEQIPDVIQQLLFWKFAESLAFCFLGICCIVLAFVISRKLHKWGSSVIEGEKTRYHPNARIVYEDHPFPVIGQLIPVTLFLIGLCHLNINWLKIWLAPKIFLIEYAAALMK